MRPRLREESGFTLVELIVASVLTIIVMAAVSNLFVSGLRAGSNTSARLTSQSSVRLALDRLEFETRCASSAALGASGADVTLTLPSQCSHAAGTYTWCVASGALTRYAGSACTGSGETFVSDVTSATPFSCVAPVSQYPRLQVALSIDPNSQASDAYSSTDLIDMRNAALTTSTATACS